MSLAGLGQLCLGGLEGTVATFGHAPRWRRAGTVLHEIGSWHCTQGLRSGRTCFTAAALPNPCSCDTEDEDGWQRVERPAAPQLPGQYRSVTHVNPLSWEDEIQI